jgi:hypothetical protein
MRLGISTPNRLNRPIIMLIVPGKVAALRRAIKNRKNQGRVIAMLHTHDFYDKDSTIAWGTILNAMQKSLDQIDVSLQEASEMSEYCRGEWCAANRHVIDDLGNSLFSISEPRCSSHADSLRIKNLKHRLHDLYANYKSQPTVH